MACKFHKITMRFRVQFHSYIIVTLLLGILGNCSSNSRFSRENLKDQPPPYIEDKDWKYFEAMAKKFRKRLKTNESDEEIESTRLVEKIIRNLKTRKIEFISPFTMKLDQRYKVELKLLPEESIETQNIQKIDTKIETIKMIDSLVSKLIGSGFTIKSIPDDSQMIIGNEEIKWIWEVTPKESEPQKLFLRVSVNFNLMGKVRPHHITDVDRTINVEIDTIDSITAFFREYWDWLSGVIAVIGSAITFLWKLTQKKSKKKRKDNR